MTVFDGVALPLKRQMGWPLGGSFHFWPAFWLRERVTILPAFSHFTAGIVPTLVEGERLVACVEDDALALPVR